MNKTALMKIGFLPVQRRATSVVFTRDELTVLVGDKSGDVYSFPTVAEETKGGDEKVKDGDDSEVKDEDERQGKGQLLLGHLSMLLDMCLAGRDTYIVTSDRDEKIRISNFPNAYSIHTFCLGHTE
nr:hypothetical protein BaRGS_011358 [Batillaria attramentaria]